MAKNRIFKNVTISKIGIYNGINFSQSAWEHAVAHAKKDPADVPIGVGHRNFNYNPSVIAQQSAYGYVQNLRIEGKKIKADLEAIPELANAFDQDRLRHFSIEGNPVNPRLDEKGIWQMDGLIFTGLAALGRDRPAVPEAKLSSAKDYLSSVFEGTLATLSEDSAVVTLFDKFDRKELKQESDPLEGEMTLEEENKLKADLAQAHTELAEMKSKEKEKEVALTQEKEKVLAELQSSFGKNFAFSNRLAIAGTVALSTGRITPADVEREMARVATLTEVELSEIEKKWKEIPAAASFSTGVRLAEQAQTEKKWDDMNDIHREIELTSNDLKIDYTQAAKRFYESHPDARKF